MTPDDRTDLSVSALLALRGQSDPIRAITERLGVKEMGPADHIRTKHEVKIFIESGDSKVAESLIQHARERRSLRNSIKARISEERGQRMEQ